MKTAIAFLFLTAPLSAAELKVHRDLPYAKSPDKLQSLDVYAPVDAKDLPVVVWIHGGGWRQGDKAGMQRKPQAFADKGYVFVSINYRFVPQVTVKEMTGDVAKAIRWVHEHAKEYGGDGDSLFVAGHSAGAHLAALVCTDESYLKAEGLTLANVKGCVPVDTAAYDIAKRVAESPTGVAAAEQVFGKTAEEHQALSPSLHVAKDKHIPPFLILHVADRKESRVQSLSFADVLKKSNVPVSVVAGEGKTHGTINSELGLPNDKPTQAMFEFLAAAVKR
jgi:arylformamidase